LGLVERTGEGFERRKGGMIPGSLAFWSLAVCFEELLRR
jgi:hypothetical protein